MSTVFIIHGSYGHPEENWFPWLKKEVENLGHQVIVPLFPTPEDQNLQNWRRAFQPYLKDVDEHSIFVGHSLGAAFVLRLLEKLGSTVDSAFLVAGFCKSLDDPRFDMVNQTFLEGVFHWDAIRAHCRHFALYQSDNDPYVPQQRGEELARYLRTNLTVVPGAGHFGEKAGYKEFPSLLAEIKKRLR